MNKDLLEKLLLKLLNSENGEEHSPTKKHPMLGKRCIIRTYSAGVHIGDVTFISDGSKECYLKNCLRLWSWSDGGLSLSAIATNGVKKARINKSDNIYLTEAIEYIPVTEKADKTFYKFIEDAYDENRD